MPCILSLSLQGKFERLTLFLRHWYFGFDKVSSKREFLCPNGIALGHTKQEFKFDIANQRPQVSSYVSPKGKKWPRVGCSHSSYDPLRYHLSNRCSPKGCAIGVELSSWKLKCEVELSEQMWLKGSQTNETTHSVNHLTLLLQKRLVREDYLFSFSYLSWLHIDIF